MKMKSPAEEGLFDGNTLEVLNVRKKEILHDKAGFSPEIFEGVVPFSGIVKLGSITNVMQSAT